MRDMFSGFKHGLDKELIWRHIGLVLSCLLTLPSESEWRDVYHNMTHSREFKNRVLISPQEGAVVCSMVIGAFQCFIHVNHRESDDFYLAILYNSMNCMTGVSVYEFMLVHFHGY